MKQLLFALLALPLLISSGCEKEKNEPYYVLWLSATVVDEADNPIEGIYLHPEGGEFVGRTGYTDFEGKVSARSYTPPRNKWIIHVEDVDGEYNRGAYESTTIDITEKVTPAIEPDGWGYSGSSYVDMGTITLKKL